MQRNLTALIIVNIGKGVANFLMLHYPVRKSLSVSTFIPTGQYTIVGRASVSVSHNCIVHGNLSSSLIFSAAHWLIGSAYSDGEPDRGCLTATYRSSYLKVQQGVNHSVSVTGQASILYYAQSRGNKTNYCYIHFMCTISCDTQYLLQQF